MLKSKKLQKGFTIVELLIVIVVIGILAALVLNTFAGVQKKARDQERVTDIKALSTQLEVAYQNNGGYPVHAQIATEADAIGLLKGLDGGAGKPPGKGWVLSTAAAANQNEYGYVPAGCSAAVAPANYNTCTSFSLTYFKEDGGLQTVKSLNQP